MQQLEDAPTGAGSPGEEQNGAAPASGSILAGVQAARERARGERAPTIALVIPGYEGRLACVYRFPTGGYKVAVKAAERETNKLDEQAQINGNADLLIACCASIVGRDPNGDGGNGSLVNLLTNEPIQEEDVLAPDYDALRFNKTLAKLLSIEVGDDLQHPGRYICREVFSPRKESTGIYEGDLSLIANGNVVFRWLQEGELRIDEETAGE